MPERGAVTNFYLLVLLFGVADREQLRITGHPHMVEDVRNRLAPPVAKIEIGGLVQGLVLDDQQPMLIQPVGQDFHQLAV